jgi:N-acetylglucosaminyl-diphospho-decaprenol L-rhamnosyltransferase
MPDLSIIIVNFNAADELRGGLASIARHLSAIPHDVCVVDNASSDGSVDVVRREFPDVQVVANRENRGFAAAVNQGIARTTGRIVLWLNPDCVLMDDGLATIVRYCDDCPDVGIVGLQLLDPDGGIQISGRAFPSYDWAVGHRHSLLTRWFPNNRYSRRYLQMDLDRRQVTDVDWVSGAGLLHPRRLIDAIGVLDEQFFMYCEDVDFCRRAKTAGLRVQYHPGARVMHQVGASSRHARRRMLVARHRSLWRYYRKHFHRDPVRDAAAAAAIWTRCGAMLVRDVLKHG